MNAQKVMRVWFLFMAFSMLIISLRVEINCGLDINKISIVYITFAMGFIGSIFAALGNMLGNGIYFYLKKNLKNERLGNLLRVYAFKLLQLY